MVTTIKLKELQDKFLINGGTLLKRGINKQGEPIILQKKHGFSSFKTRLTFTKEEYRDRTFNHLTRIHKNLFKSDE